MVRSPYPSIYEKKEELEDAPHMARGGTVPDLLGDLTPGASTQAAPVDNVSPLPTTLPKVSENALALPSRPAPSPAQAPRLPGFPDLSPQDLDNVFGKYRNAIQKYGPEEGLNLEQDIATQENSFPSRLTSGLKGFADAIMMGVAGAGNPGWEQQYQQAQTLKGQRKLDALKNAGQLNMQQTEAGMTIDKMDPSSELSKVAQATYAPLFQKLNYQLSALKGMSAANIESALALMAQFGGAEKQALIKEFELEIERSRMAAAAGKTASEEEMARQKQRTDAASELLKRSGNARFWGVPIPFTSDVSGKEQDAAKKVLMEQIGGGEPPPYGQTTTRGGIEYEWSPVTKKYHRKQG